MLQINHRAVRRGALTLSALVLALGLLGGCGKKDGNASAASVIATYQGGQVTQAEFDKFMAVSTFLNPTLQQYASQPNFPDQMLQQMIATQILAGKADDKTKSDADKNVDTQIGQYQSMFDAQGGKGTFDKQMQQNKITKDDVKHYMQLNMYAIDGAESKVDDKQVQDAYNSQLKNDPNAFDVATVSHILIGLQDPNTGKDIRTKDEALARANEVEGKLKNGEDFAALAKEYSDDPGSKDNGGKYVDAPVSQWVEGFKKAAIELPLNKISDPVETDYGYHIMKVESRSTKTFDDVKEQLRSQIAENNIYDFMDKELPGLIVTDTLKQKESAPAPTSPATPAPAAPQGNAATPSQKAPTQ